MNDAEGVEEIFEVIFPTPIYKKHPFNPWAKKNIDPPFISNRLIRNGGLLKG